MQCGGCVQGVQLAGGDEEEEMRASRQTGWRRRWGGEVPRPQTWLCGEDDDDDGEDSEEEGCVRDTVSWAKERKRAVRDGILAAGVDAVDQDMYAGLERPIEDDGDKSYLEY
jgi:hypothetical protein